MPIQAMDFASMGSNLGRAIMSAGGAKDAAYLDATKKMADIDMAQGRGEYFRAQADDLKLKAAEARRFEDAQKPENITRIATGLAGLTEDKVPQVHDYFTNGNFGITPGYSLPTDQAGPTTPDVPKPAPGWATPEALTRIGQYRGALSSQGGLAGKSDFANLIGGMKGIWEQQQLDDAKAGKFTPQMAQGLNGLKAAEKGNLYGVHEFGTINNATGNLDFNQPYLDKNASAIAQNRAQAASAYSTANLNRARIPEVQSQIDLNKSKIGADSVVINPDGTQTIIKGSGKSGKAPTEFQGKAALYGARAKEAHDLMDNLEGMKGADAYSRMAVTSLGGNGVLNTLANPAMSKSTQKVIQAQRDFLNAVLRQESGAVIGPTEFENGKKQYFPQLGDTEDVIKQKRRNRETAIMGFDNIAGSAAYEAPPIEDGEGNPPAAQPTSAAIAHLVKNPNLAPAFAAKYGKDATDRALGKVR